MILLKGAGYLGIFFERCNCHLNVHLKSSVFQRGYVTSPYVPEKKQFTSQGQKFHSFFSCMHKDAPGNLLPWKWMKAFLQSNLQNLVLYMASSTVCTMASLVRLPAQATGELKTVIACPALGKRLYPSVKLQIQKSKGEKREVEERDVRRQRREQDRKRGEGRKLGIKKGRTE